MSVKIKFKIKLLYVIVIIYVITIITGRSKTVGTIFIYSFLQIQTTL